MIKPINSHVDLNWLASQFPNLTGLQELETGGQKHVFAAHDRTDGDVVLKLMHPGTDHARTEREFEAARRVQAKRMPRIFEQGQLSGNTGIIFWFREQRIQGKVLRDRIITGVLTYHELLRLALHICETLVAAAAVNIVHRDIKPANIILTPEGEFWLIDFGLARHLDRDSITATAAPGGCGTIGYAPAEQCRNNKPNIDARADLFALGVTLYEAATGRNPHLIGARDALEVIKRASTQQLPHLGSHLSRDFADFVTTLAQPNLVHRPQTASDAHQWISELCEREGVQ